MSKLDTSGDVKHVCMAQGGCEKQAEKCYCLKHVEELLKEAYDEGLSSGWGAKDS